MKNTKYALGRDKNKKNTEKEQEWGVDDVTIVFALRNHAETCSQRSKRPKRTIGATLNVFETTLGVLGFEPVTFAFGSCDLAHWARPHALLT